MYMLRNGCLVYTEASSDPALRVASEVVEGKAFSLAVCEELSHRLSNLSHPGVNIAVPFLFPFLLLAIFTKLGSGESGVQDERVDGDLLEAIVQLRHFYLLQ